MGVTITPRPIQIPTQQQQPAQAPAQPQRPLLPSERPAPYRGI
jgi:hypothetical protein